MGVAESTVPQQPDFDTMDLYEVLDVPEDATNDEIKVSLSLRSESEFNPRLWMVISARIP